MSVIDAIIAKKLCGGGGGGSVPKPLTYDYMPVGYPTKAMETVTLMEEQAVEFVLSNSFYMAQITNAPEIVEGQTYTVNWDGTEYICVSSLADSGPIIGNLSFAGIGDDTGEPFAYIYMPDEAVGQFATLDTSPTHTISVKTTVETVTPMTYDYMPEGYPSKSVQTTTLMEEQELAFADDKGLYFGPSPAIFDIVIGGTYTVIWDGTEYQCIGSAVNSRILLGNLSIVANADDTGEPFVYVPAEGRFYTLDTSATHTISVKEIQETVTPLAEEFLPNIPADKLPTSAGTTVFYYV